MPRCVSFSVISPVLQQNSWSRSSEDRSRLGSLQRFLQSKVTAYELRSIIWEFCEGLSTRQKAFEEVATLLSKERAVAREPGHTKRCFTEEEEALLYKLLAEIQTQMQMQTKTKTTKTKEDEEKLGVMTWQMCESSDRAIPKNYVVFTFRPYTAEGETGEHT
ncbi:hypothetical protein TYRP_012184 [Tyrophagus putrescentiae]|nr:hypothetical protein TYRP_012184 [Tyrophagus putrescentiae]